jgi:flagellar biosynthetic protein FliR
VLFQLMDGKHYLMRSVAASFDVFPAGAALPSAALAELLSSGFGSLFELGARVAAPVSGLLLLVNGLIGFLNRVTPQLSIFNVGFPLTVAAGLLGTLCSLPALAALFSAAHEGVQASLAGLLGL